MGYGSGMGWTWLFWLLLVVGIVLLLVVAARALGVGVTRGPVDPPEGRRARDVLDERYARGEITTEEYQERRHALGDGA